MSNINDFVIEKGVLKKYVGYDTVVVIPDGVRSIGERTFAYCSSLTSVTIPDSITIIGSSAFEGCTGLTSVDIPDSVKSIDYSAFAYCYNLTSVTIPDSVKSIDDFAFMRLSGVEKFVIYTTKGSYADEYAKRYYLKVVYI